MDFDREYLTRPEAAEFLARMGLGITRTTLAKFATTGDGPAFFKFGNRCVYRPEDLRAWVSNRMRAAGGMHDLGLHRARHYALPE